MVITSEQAHSIARIAERTQGSRMSIQNCNGGSIDVVVGNGKKKDMCFTVWSSGQVIQTNGETV